MCRACSWCPRNVSVACPSWRTGLSVPAHAAQVISDPAFLEGVVARGERLREGLRSALAGNPHVKEVRGLGLICGVQLDVVRPSSLYPGPYPGPL